jgi:hypothetical protein
LGEGKEGRPFTAGVRSTSQAFAGQHVVPRSESPHRPGRSNRLARFRLATRERCVGVEVARRHELERNRNWSTRSQSVRAEFVAPWRLACQPYAPPWFDSMMRDRRAGLSPSARSTTVYSLPDNRSTTQQPRQCGPGTRKCPNIAASAQPASSRASASSGRRSKARPS